MIFYGYLFAFLYAFFILGIGALAYKLGLDRKYSRKIVHILIGFEWFIFSKTVGASLHFIIICLLFLAFLALVYRKNWLPMMSSAQDNAKGTVFYAVSMTLMASASFFLPEFLPYFGIAVLATSVGDGFGGVLGQAVKQKHRLYKNKTLVGTLAVFLFTALSVLLFDLGFSLPLTVSEILAISLLCAGVELLSTHGLDNIFVPLSVSIFSYLLATDVLDTMQFALAFAPLLVALTVEKKKLTRNGALSAVLLDLIVALAFGDRGFLVIAIFFALSLVGDSVKKLVYGGEKKSECRTAWQVLTNATFGALCAVSYLIFPHKYFLFLFILSFAQALGDTVASGFGALATHTYDIFRRCKIEKGESGGVSFIGTFSAIFFTLTFSAIGGLLFSLTPSVVLTISLCAILGIFFDTFLGSLVQLRFRCEKCGKIIETPIHCEQTAQYHSGVYPFDNSFVNLISGAFSVACFVILIFLF